MIKISYFTRVVIHKDNLKLTINKGLKASRGLELFMKDNLTFTFLCFAVMFHYILEIVKI